jgi:hypothetical protein
MASSTDDPTVVRTLGVLSFGEMGRTYAGHREDLLRLAGVLAEEDRSRIARYLRGGKIVFAAMEHTKDVIDGVFETPGGSGILTDGSYYWRRDSADYVEHYGIALPREFVEHVVRSAYIPPDISPHRLLEIDRFLMEHGTGGGFIAS